LIGETIREYEIISELGAGGYGVVYRAHDTNINRDVAIKVILPQYANQPEFIQNFEAEARLVAQLEHKDIVPLYAYWRDEQGAFLVMRYIRGGSLRGMLTKQGALPLTRVLRIVEQIAEALNVAHEAGVVHRDLKPDNILVDERGNAYLTDFGIAKQTNQDDQSATGAIKGTFAYLSPEQIQQTQVSPQTDIYAFGIMLYELLAGQHPFHNTPVGMMIMKHLQEPVPDVRLMRDTLAGAIADVIYKATAKDPEERYTSTLEMVAELKQAIDGSSPVSTLISQPIIEKKKPTTAEERNRFAMLENVQKFWIEGVLENSLHDTAMLDLGMKPESGAVDNPWDTLIRTQNGEETLTEEGIANVFDRMNGKLLILGDPGSGKTTTLLSLARDLLARAEVDDQHPIPVVLNLSSWSENQALLTEWLIEDLNSKYQVPRKVGTQWVENDELLLLLDGLDEVADNVRDACVQAINTYRGEHGFVDVVVCSRIKDYESLSGQLKLNGAIVIQPLDDEQIVQYLDELGSDVAVIRDMIIRDIQLRELAHSPLMLSIMILAYQGKSADEIPEFDDMESQRQHLFDAYVQRMFDRRIGEKAYSEGMTKQYLSGLAKQLQDHAQTIFYIEEIQTDWLNAESHKKRYVNIIATIHFVGSWLSLVLILGLSIFVAASQLSRFGVDTALSDDLVLLIVIIISGFISIPTTFFTYRDAQTSAISPVESVTWTFKAVIQNIRGKLGQALFIGAIFGTILGLVFTVIFEARTGFAMSLGTLLGHFTLYAHSRGFTTATVDTKVRPNEGMWKSLQYTLQTGMYSPIFFSVGMGSCLALAYDLTLGLMVAVSIALPLFLSGIIPDNPTNPGAFALAQHVTLRYLLEREHQLPRNLAKFLDHAVALILMRKVGGGYIFIHRYLLEYFADLDINQEAR
jgi:serine/threonine protein kinase